MEPHGTNEPIPRIKMSGAIHIPHGGMVLGMGVKLSFQSPDKDHHMYDVITRYPYINLQQIHLRTDDGFPLVLIWVSSVNISIEDHHMRFVVRGDVVGAVYKNDAVTKMWLSVGRDDATTPIEVCFADLKDVSISWKKYNCAAGV